MMHQVELELQGYLAAIDEGLPISEPRSPAIAAVVLQSLVREGIRALTRTRGARRATAKGPSTVEAARRQQPAHPRFLEFARYLYLQGYLRG